MSYYKKLNEKIKELEIKIEDNRKKEYDIECARLKKQRKNVNNKLRRLKNNYLNGGFVKSTKL